MILLDTILHYECDIDTGFDGIQCKYNKVPVLLVEGNFQPCHIFLFFLGTFFFILLISGFFGTPFFHILIIFQDVLGTSFFIL